MYDWISFLKTNLNTGHSIWIGVHCPISVVLSLCVVLWSELVGPVTVFILLKNCRTSSLGSPAVPFSLAVKDIIVPSKRFRNRTCI